jgi:hypothetical protein
MEIKDKYYKIIYQLVIVFYFTRTIFPFFRYLFLLFTILSIITIVYQRKIFFDKSKIKYLALPVALLLIFIVNSLFSIKQTPLLIKEAINGIIVLFIVYLIDFNVFFKKNKHFLKLFLYVIELTGIVAIVRLLIVISGNTIPFSDYIFSIGKFNISLVSDYNIYSLYFIIGIIIIIKLSRDRVINNYHYFIGNLILIVNILFSTSRRAYIVYLIFIITMVFLIILNKNRRQLFIHIAVLFFILFTMFIIAKQYSYELYRYDKKNGFLSFYFYKIDNLFNSDENISTFKQRFWLPVINNYWNNYNLSDTNSNLFYNSNFKEGLLFWSENVSSAGDSISLKLLVEKKDTFLRISRFSGRGFWSLCYTGRPIFYYKDVCYELSFKYRIVKGKGVPFLVGWWAKENDVYIYNLHKRIIKTDGDWNICKVSHTFKKSQINPVCFLNNQLSNTIIDVKDIYLKCKDTVNSRMFVDQINSKEIFNTNDYMLDTINYLTISRLERWTYAKNIFFSDFKWKSKIFGESFNYLHLYGEKFYNDKHRIDYPHNPIISSFLYSGILGGLFYIYILVMVFWYYWKYRKYHMVFFLMYLVTFFFMMFSGNSHFSVPIFTFLSLIPFLTKYKIDKNIISKME